MDYIYRFFLAVCCVVFLQSCGEKDFIEIDSLSADGDEFYCNQKVKLWMCVNSSDLWHTTYEWTCDGGTLTQPQGLNEMTWKAPASPGVYTVTCRATVGGESQVRSHKMYVSSYFFDKFEKTPHSMSLQSGTTSGLKKENDSNQYLQVKVNSATEINRYVRRAFGDETLYTPFSTRMKIGFEQYVPDVDTIKVGSKIGQQVLEYRWNMRADLSNSGAYINQIRLLWFPGQLKEGQTYPEAMDADGLPIYSLEGTRDYNVQLIVQWTSVEGKKITYNEYHKMNTLNTFVPKLYQTVSMSVDAEENFLVHVAGNEVLRSDLVHRVRTENAAVGHISINNWEIYIPNGDGGRNVPVVYMDDAYASTVEILK